MQVLWFLLILLFIAYEEVSSLTTVKIVEGVDKLYETALPGTTSTPQESQLEFVKPMKYSGPESLYSISKRCFIQDIDRWEYRVCPFRNITQKRHLGSKETLLGVWGMWNVEYLNPSPHDEGERQISRRVYNSMEYVNGSQCGDEKDSVSTSTTLNLKCGENYDKFKILEVESDKVCHHRVFLSIPFPCSILLEGYDNFVNFEEI